jgi:hypothetical protein
VKDPQEALSLATIRAQQEGRPMVVWYSPHVRRFERYVVRHEGEAPPRTFNAEGQRVEWVIWNRVKPGETALSHQRLITPDRYW